MTDFNKTRLYADIQDRDDTIKKQQQEIGALKAYCHRLEVFITRTVDKVPDTPETHWIYPSMLTLKRALRFKPDTCLDDRDKSHYVRGFIDGYQKGYDVFALGDLSDKPENETDLENQAAENYTATRSTTL